MANNWDQLYALQDWALARLRNVEHQFYLSGGTALSRGYYDHRYSEDLGFFVNDVAEFEPWRDRCLNALRNDAEKEQWQLEIVVREERFGRAFLHGPLPLKLEFINDVPFRVGKPLNHPALGRLDTKENILANKISALIDRDEPKDLADVFWPACRDDLDLLAAIDNAQGKAACIFPPLVARSLGKALRLGVPRVPWRHPPEESEFRAGIERLINGIVA